MNQPQTFGDLKRIIAKEPRGDWPARCNRGMTHSQALKVLGDGLVQYPDDMKIADAVRGDLYMRNVLRECRSRAQTVEE